MMTSRIAPRAAGALLAVLAASLVCAATKINPGNMSPYSKTQVSINLYTKPDPWAGGGLRGVIAGNPSEVLGVLAMPQDSPTFPRWPMWRWRRRQECATSTKT